MGSVGIGQLIHRLIQFNETQTKRPENNNMEFWRTFVGDFFTESSIFKYIVWNDKETRTFELPTKVLPRFFKLSYDGGMREMTYVLENPREYSMDSRTYLMNCTRTKMICVFDGSQVVTNGHLRVTFTQDLKILCWEFDAHKHQVLIPRTFLESNLAALTSQLENHYNSFPNSSAGGKSNNINQSTGASGSTGNISQMHVLPQPPVNEYGITSQVMRCYEIAEVIASMEDLMDFSAVMGVSPMETLPSFTSRHVLKPPPNQDFHYK